MNWLWLCVSLGVVVGCVHRPTGSTTPKDAKLAVLPPDAEYFPMIAQSLGASLANLKVPGVTETIHSKVSLEVAQLAIECNEPTDDCYAAVGSSLEVDLLLFARVEQTDDGVRISATLFNVGEQRPDNTVNKVFRNKRAASRGSQSLVDELVDKTRATARK